MARDIIESDWKLFRQLHSVALERFCERTLAEFSQLISATGKNAHERYVAVFRLVERRDKELAEAFDDLRRSTALLQLAIMRSRGLVSDDELARFSPEARAAVQRFQAAR
jgi:hypothetical protein